MDSSYQPNRNFRASETQRQAEQPSSILLRLPGEIRNRVYKYALYSPSGLHCKRVYRALWYGERSTRYTLSIEDNHGGRSNVDINQLKYANRQLHSETAGLELKINRIIFSIEPGVSFDPHPIVQLQSFIEEMAWPKHSWLRTLVLRPEIPDSLSRSAIDSIPSFMEDIFRFDFYHLSNFWKRNEDVQIKYVISSWKPAFSRNVGNTSYETHFNPYAMMDYGVFLSNALLDKDMSFMVHNHWGARILKEMAFKWSKDVRTLRAKLPALKFFPAVTEFDDKEAKRIKSWLTIDFYGDHLTKWFHFVETWMKDGV